MNRLKLLLALAISIPLSVTFGQNNGKIIKGYVIGGTGNDSIYFNALDLNAGYFEQTHFAAKVMNHKFEFTNELTYPQMYSAVFLSDAGKRVGRPGLCFFDPTTTSVHIDFSSPECSSVDGNSGREFSDKFLPFIFREKGYDCKAKDYEQARWSSELHLDSAMHDYVLQNSNSYVALWCLIQRFRYYGESEIRRNTLATFSDTLKKTKIWRLLNQQFKNALVKQNEQFPKLNLQDSAFQKTQFNLDKGKKYTLVDFWFSRCKPCLADIPKLKALYERYKSKGFNLVSISTDKEADLPLWKKKIIEYRMSWKQYLDENAEEAAKIPVIAFPTNFLLDSNGKVLLRDISLTALSEKLKNDL